MNNTRWRATHAICFTILLISTDRARAHDYRHPELNGWYESLHSGKGPCCDGTDATRVDDADWETQDGHYRVLLHGEWINVPNSSVVTEPNRYGPAVVWPYMDSNGTIYIRCFLPGADA